jgi:hypothetical protein
MSVDIRETLVMSLWIMAVAVVVALPLGVIVAPYVIEHNFNIAADGQLTHEEFMGLSSKEAKLLRVCQRDAASGRFGGWGSYPKLKAAQQREGQPTMPKFVDPGDPPSFQETMWKMGYKCQEDDWLSYIEE